LLFNTIYIIKYFRLINFLLQTFKKNGWGAKKGAMKEVTEMLIYDLAFRVRLFIALKLSEENRVEHLSDREVLLLELIDTKGSMNISEISRFYPKVSNSTISTTISKLWKEKQLVEKNILPENQRITTVSLTDEGRRILSQIKEKQSEIFNTVAESLGLSAEPDQLFHQILKKSIVFFDALLDLRPEKQKTISTF
jgi:DNA-binding MarR family transcriptional regulator